MPIASFSQTPIIQTSADKNDILIGEQVKVTIRSTFHPGIFNMPLLVLPDSIPHFEMVETGKADTVTKDDSQTIEQTIVFTSFDSGQWVIPPIHVNSNDTALHLFTDPVTVTVSYSPADSSNQLRDIKPIMEVKLADYTWLYIAGGVVLLLLIGFLVWWYMKNRKPKPVPVMHSKLSPYDEAMQELQKLKAYNLQIAEEVKMYHTKLSGIFKRYLGRKQNINLDNRTTSDLLIKMSENGFRQENISELATALRCSDAVKFAKYIPTAIESEECAVKIKETINLIEQQTTNNKP